MAESESTELPLGVTIARTKISWKQYFGIFAPAFLWIYILVQLFVFDIDRGLIGLLAPGNEYLADYKFFFWSSLVALIWLRLKTKTLALIFLYLLVYPLLFLFAIIPGLILRRQSWVLAFAVLNSFLLFFQSIKFNFIIGTIIAACFLIIETTSSKSALVTATLTLLLVLTIIHGRAFLFVFRPSSVFQLYLQIFKKPRENFLKEMFFSKR